MDYLMEETDRLLSTREAAVRLGRPMRTLQDWRYRGTAGPPWARIEGRCMYRLSELDAWIEERFTSGTPAA